MADPPTSPAEPSIKDQAGKLLGQAAGYVGHRTIEMGLRLGLVEAIARHPDGITVEALAAETGHHPFYVEVWCRSALASEVLDRADPDGYRLAPHIDTLLLDRDAPVFTGGLFSVLEQPEVFDWFAERLPSGEGTWWDQCGPEFIRAVSLTGGAFNNRLIPEALDRVPDLSERLAGGAAVLELACGVGIGLVKLMTAYPNIALVGLDGDRYSLDLAAENLREAGLGDRVKLVHSTLEDLDRTEEFDLVTINVSMHEARDIEKVAANVHRALKPDGRFVISDFPFPETTEALRTTPGRIMSGIQFFEALIGDQLLPTAAFVDLLDQHGFRDVDAFEVTPVHAVTHGRK